MGTMACVSAAAPSAAIWRIDQITGEVSLCWHCQSKFVYFAKMSEPDFAAIDFPAFFRVDLTGSLTAPSI